MRFETAVDRLGKIADACSDVARYRDDLSAAYAYGDILTGADVEVVQVALTVDVPAEELPWRAEPADLRGLAEVLRLDRAPVRWVWRPAGEAVGNHEIVGPVRIWTRIDGRRPRRRGAPAAPRQTAGRLAPGRGRCRRGAVSA